jgi:LuxR family maltose regulon positive regulatory protein
MALAFLWYRAGALDDARATAERALRRPEAGALPPWALGTHRVAGLVAYERDDLAGAEAHFRAVVDGAERAVLMVVRDATMGLALTYQAQGRTGEAREVAEGLITLLLRTGNTEHLPAARALEARLAAQRGEAAHAAQWLRTVSPAGRIDWASVLEDTSLTRARVVLAVGTAPDAAAVRPLLADLRRSAAAQHLTVVEIRALVLQAVAAGAAGDPGAAADALDAALSLGAPGGVVRSFADAGPALAPVLREAIRRRPADAYPRRLLAALAGPPGAAQADESLRPATGAAPAPADRLTGRETEVLACLVWRLSNKEIAAELGISPATVKRHVSNICDKIGARNRRQAVRAAGDLGFPVRPPTYRSAGPPPMSRA